MDDLKEIIRALWCGVHVTGLDWEILSLEEVGMYVKAPKSPFLNWLNDEQLNLLKEVVESWDTRKISSTD